MRTHSLASFAALPTLLLVGCTDPAPTPPASPCADPQQISLPNCASGPDRFSDEACIALDDAIRRGAMASDMRAPVVTAPTEGMALPAATPFTFAWDAPVALRPRARPMTVRDELARWTTLIPEAEAHCLVFSDRGYELRFKVGSTVIFRRQQAARTWTPTSSQWDYLARTIGTQTAELTVYTASFSASQIGAGAGPFYATAPRRFTIAR